MLKNFRLIYCQAALNSRMPGENKRTFLPCSWLNEFRAVRIFQRIHYGKAAVSSCKIAVSGVFADAGKIKNAAAEVFTSAAVRSFRPWSDFNQLQIVKGDELSWSL